MIVDSFYALLLMRRIVLLGAVLLSGVCALWAQPDGPPPGGPPPGAQAEMDTGSRVDHELKHLTQMLDLSAAQQTQVKALLTDQKAQLDTLRKSVEEQDGPPSETIRQKASAIRDDTNSKIAALLSDDQKTKYSAWLEKRKEAEERRRQQQGDGPPPPPPGDGPGGGGPGGGPPGA